MLEVITTPDIQSDPIRPLSDGKIAHIVREWTPGRIAGVTTSAIMFGFVGGVLTAMLLVGTAPIWLSALGGGVLLGGLGAWGIDATDPGTHSAKK